MVARGARDCLMAGWGPAFILIVAPLVVTGCAGFTVVLLPDTQYYSRMYGDVYVQQAEWIVANRQAKRIEHVVHLGDIVHNEDQSQQWVVADAAHDVLDAAGVPYTVIPGNHDLPSADWGLSRNSVRYNNVFGPARFSGPGFAYYQGGFPAGRNDNNYSFFEAEGLEFMVLGLEHAPSKDAMCWAGDVMESNRQRRAIVTTHCYQRRDGLWNTGCDNGYNVVGAHGQVLWEELLSRYPQIFMIVNGHVGESFARTTDRNGGAWGPVHEVITDYQFDRHGRDPNHGNGWLRTLRFDPEQDLIFADVVSVIGETQFNPPDRDNDGILDYPVDPAHPDHKYTLDYPMSQPIAGETDPIPTLERFSDRRVNSDNSRHQRLPAVARAPNGSFVVVWEDDSQGAQGVYQIYARGFDVNGCELFSARTVNSVPDGQQLDPDIAMDDEGNFVVVWEDDADENGFYQIVMRGFHPDGTERFSQRTANSVSSGQQRDPVIAVDSAGGFVVAWEDDADENGYYQIVMRGFDASGSERFSQRTVNAVADGQQRDPAIAAGGQGDFVVAWEDDADENGYYQILMRGFDASGAQAFSQRTVNAVADGQQLDPDIGMDGQGNFVVVWEDDADGNNFYQIVMRGFDAAGQQAFSQRTVNSVADGQQLRPSIGVDPGGDFAVVWEDDEDDNGWYQIMVRGFDAAGTEILPQETVNRNARGQQVVPVIAFDDDGRFVIAWQDDLERNGWWEILARGCSLSGGC